MNSTPDFYPRKEVSAPEEEVRLTAYALGELDAEGAATLERRLESDESLRAELDAIRVTVAQMEGALGAEPAPGLTQAQREAIAHGGAVLHDDERPVIFTLRRVWAGVGLAAAAGLAIVMIPMFTDSAARETDFAIATKGARDNAVPRSGPADAPADRAQEPGAEWTSSAAADPAAPVLVDATGGGAPKEGAAGSKEESQRVFARPKSSGAAAAGEPLASSPPVKDGTLRQRASGDSAGHGAGAGLAGRGDGPANAPAAAGGRRAAPMESEKRVRPPARKPPGARPGAGGLGSGGPAAEDESFRQAPARGAERGFADDAREGGDFDTSEYAAIVENDFIRSSDEPLSTFSIDVDTASYSNVRRFLKGGTLPPADAVRIEELVNYFDYAYEPATGEVPFSVNVDTAACPWNPKHQLMRIGLKGQVVERDMRPATSLVFLLDVSGSMRAPNKLPLLKQSIKLLVESLTADDRVAIVGYAGAAGLVLPSTYCDEKPAILAALDGLRAGGSTNGGEGIDLAYEIAGDAFIKDGVNRVILCTDGDFNVGVSSQGALDRLIEEKRESGVFLSVLGFGTGNLADARMESLSNKGNGNAAYIDSIDEANKVLVEEMSGTLVTIAKDVKIQVDFNPARVGAYRLIGYENRALAAQDFADDRKDAGEIGAGHTVTALYELIPPGDESLDDGDEVSKKPASDFVKPKELVKSDLLLKVKLRYKAPDGDDSTEIAFEITDDDVVNEAARGDLDFAAAVASFGMILRDSKYKGDATYASVADLAAAGLENDAKGRRAEFVTLVERAQALSGGPGMTR